MLHCSVVFLTRGSQEPVIVHLVFNLTSKVDRKKISIFSNNSHFEWKAGLSDTILKGDHPRTIPAKFTLIWFNGFRGEDLM